MLVYIKARRQSWMSSLRKAFPPCVFEKWSLDIEPPKWAGLAGKHSPRVCIATASCGGRSQVPEFTQVLTELCPSPTSILVYEQFGFVFVGWFVCFNKIDCVRTGFLKPLRSLPALSVLGLSSALSYWFDLCLS
jgi:hypothetical protein